jgi:hypothetical protein
MCRLESHSESELPILKALPHFETPILRALSIHNRREKSRSVRDPENRVDAVPFSGCDLPDRARLLLEHLPEYRQHELLTLFDLLKCEERRFREEYYQSSIGLSTCIFWEEP